MGRQEVFETKVVSDSEKSISVSDLLAETLEFNKVSPEIAINALCCTLANILSKGANEKLMEKCLIFIKKLYKIFREN